MGDEAIERVDGSGSTEWEASEKDVLWGGLGSSITPSDCQFLYFCAQMRFKLERNLIRLRFFTRLALLVQTLFPKHMVQYVIQTVKLDESHMAR